MPRKLLRRTNFIIHSGGRCGDDGNGSARDRDRGNSDADNDDDPDEDDIVVDCFELRFERFILFLGQAVSPFWRERVYILCLPSSAMSNVGLSLYHIFYATALAVCTDRSLDHARDA